MRIRRFLHASALLCAIPGLAQTPGPEYTLGYSAFRLRPATGLDQWLNGFALGFRSSFDARYSIEAVFNRQTGTEGGSVNLRQLGVMGGPCYTRTFTTRWKGYAHALVGFQQLSAWEGPESDQKTTLALAPGVGVDFNLNRNVAFRAQEDLVLTRYAGISQRNTAFYLGVVLKR